MSNEYDKAMCVDNVYYRFLTEQDGRERRRPAVARLRQSQVNNNVLVVSDTRLVQKMERQQDEIFQL